MKLIDKTALVAEIETLSAYLDSLHEQRIIEKILSIIDTLEVKEVVESKLPNPRFPHLDSIIDKVFGTGNLESFEYEEAKQLVLLAKEELLKDLEVKEVDLEKEIKNWIERNQDSAGFYDIIEFAKHFFELGLQAKTDKELVEEIYSHIDSIKDTADRMTSGNFMHNRAAIKFSANTIAKVLELMGLKTQKGE
jgi:hypothetical protein